MGKALEGVRVVDLGQLLPGPYAALLLRKQGAEVVKVELPHRPDPARLAPRFYRALNAGKRRRELDYSKEPGRSKLLELLSNSDVLIENFRPGLLEKRGLGPHALLRSLPRLVYCSISGYGSKGSRKAGHDLNYQAEAGLLRPPAMPPVATADLAGACEAAFRIAAALAHRAGTGRGAFLDVSMTESARPWNILAETRPWEGLAGRWWAGEDPFYRLYRCRDGWLAVAALENSAAVELLRALGLERLERLLAARKRNSARLGGGLSKAFLARGRADWARLFRNSDACVTPLPVTAV